MTALEKLTAFIDRRIYPDKREKFIEVNTLRPLIHGAESLTLTERLHPSVMESALLHVTAVLRGIGIEPIHFKGLTLSRRVYDEPNLRKTSDIDFLIPEEDYERAREALLENGASIWEEFDGHHLTLNYRGVKIEMHTSLFHPGDGIELTLEKSDLCKMKIRDTEVTTLAPTALFLLLILHYFTHANKGKKYRNDVFFRQYYQKVRTVPILRLLDLALTVEKLGDQIDWQRCAAELAVYCDCEAFRMMLAELEDIFPDTLPRHLAEALRREDVKQSGEYTYFHRISAERDRPYDDVMADILRHDAAEYACLPEMGEEYRFRIDEHAQDKPRSYLISGIPPEDSDDLSFRFDLSADSGKLRFSLDVKDNVLTYLHEGDYPENDTTIGYCDSFTLCIVACGKRCTQSFIHSFLTRNDEGETYLSTYSIDALCATPMKGIAESTFTPRADGYSAEISVPLDFLGLREKEDAFYLNVIVSDSDDERGARTALALDPTPTAWDDCRSYPLFRY